MSQEVLEGNRLIAEFTDAWEYRKPDLSRAYKGDHYLHKKHQYVVNDIELKYHTSWDWLMPVTEKINSLGIDDFGEPCFVIHPTQCFITSSDEHEIKFNTYVQLAGSQIMAAWKTVVQFINFYNQTQKR